MCCLGAGRVLTGAAKDTHHAREVLAHAHVSADGKVWFCWRCGFFRKVGHCRGSCKAVVVCSKSEGGQGLTEWWLVGGIDPGGSEAARGFRC